MVVLAVFKQEPAIAPGAVVRAVLVPIALIHMHIMQTIARLKREQLIRLTVLRAPAGAVGVNAHGGVGHGLLNAERELFDEVIAGARATGRDATHVAAVKHAAALVVEREAARLVGHKLAAVPHIRQPLRDLVAKLVVREVEEVCVAALARARAGIHGNAEFCAGGNDMDVKVGGAAARFGAQAEDAAGDQGVGFRHCVSIRESDQCATTPRDCCHAALIVPQTRAIGDQSATPRAGS